MVINIYDIIQKFENFAPLELQEDWDNSGWQILPNSSINIKKILICLTLTKDILYQAKNNSCDLIISHHPFLFPHSVPIDFNVGIPVYSAHTNLDRAMGGTTDSLIDELNLDIKNIISEDFVRTVELNSAITSINFVKILKDKLNLSYVISANFCEKEIKKIAFCAGSGAEFIKDLKDIDIDIFITGDVKYHSAVDNDVIIIDIGHFGSEKPVLKKIEKILKNDKNFSGLGVIIANEKNPFTII